MAGMLCDGGGVVVVGELPVPLSCDLANLLRQVFADGAWLPAAEDVDGGCLVSNGAAASDELFRCELAHLPDMVCGCGATIVV